MLCLNRNNVTLEGAIAVTLLAALTGPFSCGGSVEAARAGGDLPEPRTLSPDAVFELSRELREISGLGFAGDSLLLAVQDEDGVVYALSPEDGSVRWRFRFAGDGDYEGVEVAGENVYVLRSDGDIFVASLQRRDRARRVRTPLRSRDDTEGLALSGGSQSTMLVAAKETLSDGRRLIYAFDTEAEALDETPRRSVDLAAVAELSGAGKGDVADFKPSGLAIDPQTGWLFVVGSVDRLIVAIDDSGTVRSVLRVPESSLPQPEGIAFGPNGDLFVASEGSRRGIIGVFHRSTVDSALAADG